VPLELCAQCLGVGVHRGFRGGVGGHGRERQEGDAGGDGDEGAGAAFDQVRGEGVDDPDGRSSRSMTPDIVTTVSSSGYRASTASRADATEALSVTSIPNVPKPSPASSESASGLRPPTATVLPAAANRRASSRPMPEVPPTMRTVRLERSTRSSLQSRAPTAFRLTAHSARRTLTHRTHRHSTWQAGRHLAPEDTLTNTGRLGRVRSWLVVGVVGRRRGPFEQYDAQQAAPLP
jgi:hypothetical protein